ncbi:MAG: leucine-rich repeat domain-containing protein [Cyclobacteriaceae bacterium]|nr:leucine-rich repeat domain-containing protein [Cyclobacteriaceae bacterium]
MVKETKEGLKILTGVNGQESLFINSDRLSDCINYLRSNDLRFITINSFQGYKAKDIAFLIELKDFLKGLSILETHYDFGVVNELHKLKYLGIPDNGKDVIDLRNFPDIEMCGVAFSERLQGLESCSKLKSLTVSNYKSKTKDLSALPSLNNLEHLSLIKTDITTLHGVECYSNLKKLEIFSASKLEAIAALQALSNSLEEIQVEQCKKINDYEALGKVKSLKKIILSESGEIKSLAFVKKLPRLEFISFWGTNVLDGNIKYCEGINYVGFDNKKHYTHKSEQFKK